MFKKVLVDVKATIELPRPRYCRSVEEIATELDYEARDLTEFIRDHRSRDGYEITVDRIYESHCEFCHRIEERENGSPVCCDKAIEEYETQLAEKGVR